MKKKIALVFGGKSAEFNVSITSASNIYNAIDKKKFTVLLLGIDQKGDWFYQPALNDASEVKLTAAGFFTEAQPVMIVRKAEEIQVVLMDNFSKIADFEVAFSIIHGTYGEDGTLQGYFKALNIPFVGPDVLGSAACMDKEITKRLLRDNGIPIAQFLSVRKSDRQKTSFEQAVENLGLPLFVKPCNAGSSVGVSKVSTAEEFDAALATAFQYDNKLLIEEAVIGKEVECAILGNEDPKASVIGEIVPTKDFYSFDAKYNDADGAKMKIPADIDSETEKALRETAVAAFKTVECEGLSRVDFFLRADNTYVLNEINTLPGFTQISMYPKLWEATGIGYSDLIAELIRLAEERFKRNNALLIASL